MVSQKINDEVALGRIEGPFDQPPLNNFHCSPLFLLPKKNGGHRLIHNLSAPKNHSINDGIPQEKSTVKYQNISHAIDMVKKLGKGCLLAKSDIETAFRLIPISKSEHHLLGFSWEEKIYYDKFLAMGASSSCLFFERFSRSLHWAMENLGFPNVAHVLDDFIFAGPPQSKICREALSTFQTVCKDS